MFKIKNN